MTGMEKHPEGITRLKVRTDWKTYFLWWKFNIRILASLSKYLMYTKNLLEAGHIREIKVITKAKYLLQMVRPKICTDSQSWSTSAAAGWAHLKANLSLTFPVRCRSWEQGAEQNPKLVSWTGKGCMTTNVPSWPFSMNSCHGKNWSSSFPLHRSHSPLLPAKSLLGHWGSPASTNDSAMSLYRVLRSWKKQEQINDWNPSEHQALHFHYWL